MSDIFRARRELASLANRLEAQGLSDEAKHLRDIIMNLMFRRSPARRAPLKSRRVTAAVKQQIIDLAETTDMHSAEIAVVLNLNPGRVSEVLQGDR
ncbi:MAG: hypothetical protein J0L52_05465 [Caulobacterales bacterium]|nr:hypothetical protein [Caulobacterales bacterium]